MKRSKLLYISMSRSEKILGWLYLAFELLLLPSLLQLLNGSLVSPMSSGTLNFVFYLINFLAIVCIFHRFLRNSLLAAWRDIWNFIQAVVLGTVAYFACNKVLTFLMEFLVPSFHNINDASISAMLRTDRVLMTIGVVLLVPLTEETIYRGLVFRNLWQTSKIAAYLLSIAAFAAIHVVGYIGSQSTATLVLCFIQYLPAGLCLAWTYTKADNLLAPVVVHAIANAVAIGIVR